MSTPTLAKKADAGGGRTPGTASPPAGPTAEPGAPAAGVPRTGFRLRMNGPVAAALSCLLLGLLMISFVGYLFAASRLQEEHFQSTARKTFANQLANALAPVGTAPDGSPVAVVDIPAIGLHQAVVVEGTTGRDLMRGPGHRRDTALPGQQGVSVLFGRHATFGAPFADLTDLRIGDVIHATTGQGESTYTVNAFGDSSHPIKDTATDRLVLVTGDSDWIPTRTLLVGARLDGTGKPDPGGRPAVVDTDRALASDTAALPALQLWALGLLLAVIAAVVAARRRMPRGAVHLIFAPVLAALLWCVHENAAALLPNLY
ncbi:sortase [Streptomyces sp. NPDC049040]|uniref:sortase n=1 Tax=Streptomyces sp. NPDC049040 TaxID=3365593 RepID=UPI003723DC44